MINIFKIGIFQKMKSSRLGQVLFEGKPKPGVIYIPYGMFANIQENIPAGVLLDQGNEESLLFLPFDIENRDETLNSDEVGYGIPKEKNRLYFRNGKITFKIDDTEGGDYAARFNELKAGFDQLTSDLNTLIAAYNVNPGGAVPISTASIDDSKIDKIEFPS